MSPSKRLVLLILLTTSRAALATAADPVSIAGYVTPVSAAPGETVGFHVSTNAKSYSIEIARIGAKREVVKRLEGLVGKQFPIPVRASAFGCDWPKVAGFTLPADLRSGYYSVKFIAETEAPAGREAEWDAFFVARSSRPGKDTSILIQLATNTYNAYNNWGGYSLYAYHAKDKSQGRRVSFERPMLGQFAQWELPFVSWAEKAGIPLDYATNEDLEFRPEMLKAYKLVLSVGHDEYWSAPMRDNLEAYIGRGGNVAFFSGNSVCWQVRAEEGGRALTCYKQSFGDDPLYFTGDHSRLATLWSHHLVNRPENTLTGVGFLWGGYHRSHDQFMDGPAAYRVHRPDHWLFEGTPLKRGDEFGGKDTIVGYECDGCELVWKDGLPYPTHRDGTPDSFVVLATCPAKWHPDDSEWYERWEKGRVGNAVLGVYTRGGTVVTVGSTDWAHGLRGGDKTVERITKNVLERLSK